LLFQGRLEIRTPTRATSSIERRRNRHRGNADNSIRGLSMNERRADAPRAGEAVVARTAPPQTRAAARERVSDRAGTRDGSMVAARVVDAQAACPASSTTARTEASPSLLVAVAERRRCASIRASVSDVGRGPSVGATVDVGASTNLTTVNIAGSTSLGAGGANVSVGAGAALGGTGASLGASLSVGAGSSTGVSLGASTSLGTGSAGASLGVSTTPPARPATFGVDLGNSARPPPAAILFSATPAAPTVALPVVGGSRCQRCRCCRWSPLRPRLITTPAPTARPPLVGAIGKLLGHP
jgi:hypothetical protein